MKTTGGINFDEQGKGDRTLVFLHYFGGSLHSWTEVINDFSGSFHCLAIDLPGFGDSDAPTDEPSVRDQSEAVLSVIRENSLTYYTLIGHSMGGKIALDVASLQPEGLQSVVLVAPSPPSPEPITDAQLKVMLDTFGNRPAIEKLVDKITAKHLKPDLFSATVADHLKISHIAWNAWLLKGSQEDLQANMDKIVVPLFVVSADSDPNFSTAYLRETFSRILPVKEFVEVKQSGHLIPVEQPVVLAAVIRSLIR